MTELNFSENRLIPKTGNYLIIYGGNGALGKKFDAYLKRQFVTESSFINRLADRHICSSIKTLPATLTEPKIRGSRIKRGRPNTTVRRPRVLDIGTLTGVTEAVSLFRMTSLAISGRGAKRLKCQRLVCFGLLDRLGLLTAHGIILRISSEWLTSLKKINTLLKVQTHLVIDVICVIIFLGDEHL